MHNLLEKNVDNKYFLSVGVQERFILTDNSFQKSAIGSTKPNFRTIGQRDLVYSKNGITDFCPTLTTFCGNSASISGVVKTESDYRIRKITPTECWWLMGFNDDDVKKVQNIGMSDSSLYKQAGNSIVTNCISLIMEHLYKAQIENTYICTDEIIGNNNCDSANLILAGTLNGGKWNRNLESNRRVYSINGISPTITTCGGGNTEPKIMINK